MFSKNQRGTINALLLPLTVVVLLLIAAGAFGAWAYGGRQDYKNNSDQKAAAAAAKAIEAQKAADLAHYNDELKDPFKTYIGPSEFGSLHVSYPRTWSAYIDESSNGDTDINGYLDPNFVPSISNNSSTLHALRIQILNQSYTDTLQGYQDDVQAGGLAAKPYALKNLSSVVGTRLTGTTTDKKNIDMVIFRLRDKTVQIWTEDPSHFGNDFANVLDKLTFSP